MILVGIICLQYLYYAETITDSPACPYTIYISIDFIHKCQIWNGAHVIEILILIVYSHFYFRGFSPSSSPRIIMRKK